MSKLSTPQKLLLDLLRSGVEVKLSPFSGAYYCQATGEYLTKPVNALLRKKVVEVKNGVVLLCREETES